MTVTVAVIGAGWAGCAAAVELAANGHLVTLFEAGRVIGGRARQVELNHGLVDNGQHILLGAYENTLRVMRMVGIAPEDMLLRVPLQMRYPPGTGMDFVAAKLPAPAHILVALLRATGLNVRDKLSLVQFNSAASRIAWQLPADCTVVELLLRFNQTERLNRLMWRPLCIAALNTPPERASAQIFLNVLKDSLGASRSASDMLLPRVDLSALFPQQAEQFIRRHNGVVLSGVRVRGITRHNDEWHVHVLNGPALATRFDQVVIATEPRQAAQLLEDLTDITAMRNMSYEPITTCYLKYPDTYRLEQPFFALIDDQRSDEPAQFVFDRGHLNPRDSGLFAAVISASNSTIGIEHSVLEASVANQLATTFRRAELSEPIWAKTITEKRATFSCMPNLPRPDNRTAFASLVIAGDYTAGRYPATLESAVSSGLAAANLLIGSAGIPLRPPHR